MACPKCHVETIKCQLYDRKLQISLIDGVHVGVCKQHGLVKEVIPCQPQEKVITSEME